MTLQTDRTAGRPRVLIVDDHASVRSALTRALGVAEFDVGEASDGIQALEQLARTAYEVVVLDVAMPRLDGMETCRRLRAAGDRTPILMLTARDTIDDRVAGLEAGADDYLVKPFALAELVARIRALVRRIEGPPAASVLQFADLRLERDTFEATRGDLRITLTKTEFLLLRHFLEHPRQVLSRSQLFEAVWGFDFGQSSNALGVYIGYLRRKTEAGERRRLLHTVRGFGYVLREER